MHIAEGILSAPVLIGGAVVAAAGVAVGLRAVDDTRIPRVAVLGSVFFVASFIHVPVGPSSVHLVLNGLAGVLLGWAAFPAMLVALLLQATLFGYGGLTVLGANTVAMAAPAVACRCLFARGLRNGSPLVAGLCGFGAGALAIELGAGLVCVALWASGRQFLEVGELVMLAHVPMALVEGLITGSIAGFLRKVKPELLTFHHAPSTAKEIAHA